MVQADIHILKTVQNETVETAEMELKPQVILLLLINMEQAAEAGVEYLPQIQHLEQAAQVRADMYTLNTEAQTAEAEHPARQKRKI